MCAVAVDKEGFLENLDDWSPQIAHLIADETNIELTPAHWAIINLVRDFYQRFEIFPTMRVLVKQVREQVSKEAGTSIYLMTLFPDTPLRHIARISGLPKPTNCD